MYKANVICNLKCLFSKHAINQTSLICFVGTVRLAYSTKSSMSTGQAPEVRVDLDEIHVCT